MRILIFCFCCCLFACQYQAPSSSPPAAVLVKDDNKPTRPPQKKQQKPISTVPKIIPEDKYPIIFESNPSYYNDGFDFPVGRPDAEHYYKAQNFKDNNHLGEDWNGKGGGNTDLGDPVYVAANGLVTYVDDICCGWGKTIRVIHAMPKHPDYDYLETVYSHLDRMDVKVGDLVYRGEQIGTIGTAHGRYAAHLHFEMRSFINMAMGPGYSDDYWGYLDPTHFIERNRP